MSLDAARSARVVVTSSSLVQIQTNLSKLGAEFIADAVDFGDDGVHPCSIFIEHLADGDHGRVLLLTSAFLLIRREAFLEEIVDKPRLRIEAIHGGRALTILESGVETVVGKIQDGTALIPDCEHLN